MSDTLITVVAIVLAAVLIFVVPVMTMADRFDATTQANIESITSEFVEDVRTTGKLTRERYNKFLENLSATGYTYDVHMEFKIQDENPGKKTTQSTKDKIGENVSYSVYTSQIEKVLEEDASHTYTLKQGDMISVTVRNTDLTLAQQMKDFMYKVVGNDNYTVVTTQGGLVQSNSK